jgi:isopenicillin N synthase-like dioxygenase
MGGALHRLPSFRPMNTVPIIDISPLVAGVSTGSESAQTSEAAGVGAAMDAACREAGFFYIEGHGVDPDLIGKLDELSRQFFALPESHKAEIAMPLAGKAWRGWFPVGGELTSGVPDLKEGLYFGAELGPDHPRVLAGTILHGSNLFPREPAELRSVVLAYLDEMTRVGQVVLGGIALGLGLDRSFFERGLTADPLILFRIFSYPPAPATEERLGVGEHTDYGLLTILGQDRSGGLQVRTQSGWIDAPPIAGAFVCNLGDMLERLTGGRFQSTPHRVRNLSGVSRLSFPFFLDPSFDAVIDRLPIVGRPADEGASDRWDHASVHGFAGTYGDYILGKVAKVFPDLADSIESAP